MRLRLLAVVAVLNGYLYAADPELLSLAMPDSQALAGVNVAPVRLSPLGQYLLSDRGPLPAAGLNQMMEASGFDPRRDLQEILFSTKAQPAERFGADSGARNVRRFEDSGSGPSQRRHYRDV